uniref:uncharacterized protein LOC124016004 isoform X2 n=1 Tax=Oncorhynchus gorbuscha TaxID=8017 RepID=UPI001EAED131|nr:uncharacterized protein LOC124016004 isoform X2 [Oncorhynchus gorbuscha]
MEQGELRNYLGSSPDTDNVAHVECCALAPSCCDQRYSTGYADWEFTSSCQDINRKHHQRFRTIERQLQYLLDKADEYQAHLLYRHDNLQKEHFAHVVPTFLRTCQPYFTYLESTARSSLPRSTPLPMYIRSRFLDFSQQLCERLEQLVLTYASFDFLSLEETDPASHYNSCHYNEPVLQPASSGHRSSHQPLVLTTITSEGCEPPQTEAHTNAYRCCQCLPFLHWQVSDRQCGAVHIQVLSSSPLPGWGPHWPVQTHALECGETQREPAAGNRWRDGGTSRGGQASGRERESHQHRVLLPVLRGRP